MRSAPRRSTVLRAAQGWAARLGELPYREAHDSATVHGAAFSYHGSHHALRSDRWAYMRYPDGSEELYDMQIDPGQFTNLANHPSHTATVEGFRQQLQQYVPASSGGQRKKKQRE